MSQNKRGTPQHKKNEVIAEKAILLGLELFGQNHVIRHILKSAQFQIPMLVSEIMVFRDTSFYVCPRCKITLEREYSRYCDRCGQRLNWKAHRQARIVYPGTVRPE